ncbi:2-dehydropantoate 2-reductase [Bacillus sp. FJAT-50079]|uniref:2-dehydropantoate 2-reductase n=1 Tax=Bacillus sp. FJAT-50079 TaxID=2833577 RepID=UPI001BCA44D1|nr:2-dehydropantoate 2-reductase [Bacillus sp. FJAT-50079]MBS4207725.1 2-dehydropantoate 2-reductase [Bacillus sp. FJAT-50079]
MKIGIIGGGALGLLFAGYIGQEYDVTLFSRRMEQSKQLELHGVHVKTAQESLITPVKARANWQTLSEQELIIIAVKQYDLEGILPILRTLPIHIPLLFIQNGMGHLTYLCTLNNQAILVGTVEHGALKIDDHSVYHSGIGKTNIAYFRGDERILALSRMQSDSFPIKLHQDYEAILEQKLIVNAIINPLTALFQVKNGKLLTNPSYLALLHILYEEIIPCFPKIKENMTIKEVERICRSTSDNQSSMFKDIEEGRRTEIDAILGYVLKRGAEMGRKLPNVSFLYESIKGMEFERGLRE